MQSAGIRINAEENIISKCTAFSQKIRYSNIVNVTVQECKSRVIKYSLIIVEQFFFFWNALNLM